jgi:formylglycine-generating enzyme
VINVNWFDAKQFTTWLSRKTGKIYRLPTEAEWEYAARAGTTTSFYWGENANNICEYANVNTGGFFSMPGSGGCGTDRTSPVGERRPNAFGLYEMLGNVNEWIEDCWNYDIASIPSDGSSRITGDCSQRAVRGGSWGTGPLRVSYRGRSQAADSRNRYFGFRVVRID